MKIVFIGAGNLATHLSQALQKSGNSVIQVYSRTELSAKVLAERLATEYTTSFDKLKKDADIYFIAVRDLAVDEVLSRAGLNGKFIVHCSGSLPLSILNKHSTCSGVLYPLQTFSKTREIYFKDIPVFIESDDSENERILFELARGISDSVQGLNSEKRKMLHISAVFACNFVNHFYAVAADFLGSEDISFDVLKPLIRETAQKVQKMNPAEAQTGPAIRYDTNVINDHLEVLDAFPDYKKLYKSISKSIFDYHKK